ncbi:hypothetical protein Bbelb_034930 [Branchiostoma belcheri]|nr:hypothetical protein Bbelb_034930 [Branchiostoma belcheri]
MVIASGVAYLPRRMRSLAPVPCAPVGSMPHQIFSLLPCPYTSGNAGILSSLSSLNPIKAGNDVSELDTIHCECPGKESERFTTSRHTVALNRSSECVDQDGLRRTA